ncbi:hypothetical protein GCM10009549_02280 [Streptomyces thermoalcalitolerans]|uniref:Histidine kinase/HSP90-like ATPase domain-containing protein n=1 Tax=Streptomyces thermoalcalitolerans TaxID=65605 RepID=A0ABP3YPH1_9ACTN
MFLACDDDRRIVRIEVTDTHPALPARLAPGSDEDGGRGLVLVDALAVDWGVRDRLGSGKTVWAECTTVPARRAGRATAASGTAT